MTLISEAFQRLFPEKDADYSFNLKYSGRFRPYGGNVRYTHDSFTFSLSKKWRGVSRDIQIGFIQGLFLKIFKEKRKTTELDLYHAFLRKVHIAIPKTKTDPLLEESFMRVNAKYLNNLIELPNLKWHDSKNRLGSYEFGSDTISISKHLLRRGHEFIDYVMYHEMLHKKHKFTCTGGRTTSHTKVFREEEARFENSQRLENALRRPIRKPASFFSRLGFK